MGGVPQQGPQGRGSHKKEGRGNRNKSGGAEQGAAWGGSQLGQCLHVVPACARVERASPHIPAGRTLLPRLGPNHFPGCPSSSSPCQLPESSGAYSLNTNPVPWDSCPPTMHQPERGSWHFHLQSPGLGRERRDPRVQAHNRSAHPKESQSEGC